jgi:hypothetical protein
LSLYSIDCTEDEGSIKLCGAFSSEHESRYRRC